MENFNQTFSIKFILLGLSDVLYLQVFFFIVFLLMYMITLSSNLLLILVVRINPTLKTPMYFFLSNLSVIDICFSTCIIPKVLVNILSKDRTISFMACSIQMYVHLAMGAVESMLLAIMAYDRFVAICRPLYYNATMNKKICTCLVSMAWSIGFLNSFILVTPVLKLPFCRSNHVNHFLCEIPPFLQMSCKDPWTNVIVIYISAVVIVMCSFFLTLISYVHIISSILNIRSSQGRCKTFSTCASHLVVVTIYYGTIIFMYIRPPTTHYPQTDKMVSLVYTAVTPMLNPFIYSIRNKEVKGTFKCNNIGKSHL